MTWQGDCSIGAAKETTYGTIVTPTKFVEFTDENLDWDPTFTQGEGLRVGSRVPRSARRGLGKQQVTGDVTVEASSKGIGWMIAAALGAVTSTQRATTGVYQHNIIPTLTDPTDSYTFQRGTPPLGGGATQAVTFPGMVCDQIEFDCSNSDIVTIKTTWNGNSVNTATAYAAPSYPTGLELFEFVEGAITIGGTVVEATTTTLASGGTAVANIRDFNIQWANNLDDGGFNLGSGGKRSRRPAVGMAECTGSITAEYVDNTFRDAYLNQTPMGLVLTFTGAGTIGTGSDKPVLQIRVPVMYFEGELPQSNGGDVITQSIDFTALDGLVAPVMSVSYVTTDVLP